MPYQDQWDNSPQAIEARARIAEAKARGAALGKKGLIDPTERRQQFKEWFKKRFNGKFPSKEEQHREAIIAAIELAVFGIDEKVRILAIDRLLGLDLKPSDAEDQFESPGPSEEFERRLAEAEKIGPG